jgi:predicted Zn-dependent protease
MNEEQVRGWTKRPLSSGAAVALVALCALGASGCATTTRSGSVGADRSQLLLLSSEHINKSSVAAYAEVLGDAKKKSTLNADPVQTERVRRIAARLIPQTAVFRDDAPGWQWEVNVLVNDQVNAWCMPGGKIAVYTGLIEKLQPTDDELAAVMGHEISHALREHARERASEKLATSVTLSVLTTLLGLGSASQSVGSTVAKLTFELPYSRIHETEADRMGVELAARAGYDPRAAITLWQKMGKVGGNKPPEILSTHPSDETRMKDLQAYADKVMPLYLAAGSTAEGK